MYKHAIVLAAGKGCRMNSELPKCAINFKGEPMVVRIINRCYDCNINDIIVVVGYKREKIMEVIKQKVTFAFQEEQLGTGHAIKCAEGSLSNKDGYCLIFPGDMPLIDNDTINELITCHEKNNNILTVATTIIDNPYGYGRICRNKENNIVKIVEERDTDSEQKLINEVNGGLYCVSTSVLFKALNKIRNKNDQNELYLTDVVEIIGKDNKVGSYIVKDSKRLLGANTMEQLKYLESLSD